MKAFTPSSLKTSLPSFWCFILPNTRTTRHN